MAIQALVIRDLFAQIVTQRTIQGTLISCVGSSQFPRGKLCLQAAFRQKAKKNNQDAKNSQIVLFFMLLDCVAKSFGNFYTRLL